MTRLLIVVEGKTEVAFVTQILAPALATAGVYASARLLGTPGHKGGRVTLDRVRRDVSTLLSQESQTFCTTMLDYYGLGTGFPTPPTGLSAREAASELEQVIRRAVVASLPDARRADARFLPYLQLHEFQALLFSDPAAFARGIGWQELAAPLAAIRAQFPTPEDIDRDPIGAPSKRIVAVHLGYRKVADGSRAAAAVGLTAMRRECPHFRQWVEQLLSLSTAPST